MTVYQTDADMAYGGYESADPETRGGRSVVPLVNWAGAMASLGLVAGLAIWGYNLAMRDVTGIPVIQALEGPMRVQPDDPGGRQADHQGLAVNQVQAAGVTGTGPDQITLAPRPIDLTTASPAQAAPLVTQEKQQSAPVADLAVTTEAEAVAGAEDAAAPETTGLAVESLLQTLAAEEDAQTGAAEIVPASLPGIARSPRPTARPAVGFASRAVLDFTTPVSATVAPQDFMDPADLTIGTRMVQFGAFDEEPQAREEWARLSGQFGEFMGGRAPVIQKAERAGRSFYRLRVTGFEDLSDARRFCSVFLAEDLACIPVVYK